MRKANKKLGSTQSDIVKIQPLGPDRYQVYFKWLEAPVVMNKQYLQTVVDDPAKLLLKSA